MVREAREHLRIIFTYIYIHITMAFTSSIRSSVFDPGITPRVFAIGQTIHTYDNAPFPSMSIINVYYIMYVCVSFVYS